MKDFLNRLPSTAPSTSAEHRHAISRVADFVTRSRSAVERDGYTRELDYVPEPEMPARFARQLLSLTRGVALVGGHDQVTEQDIGRVTRVALDSIPAQRRDVLDALAQAEAPLSVEDLANQLPQYSGTTIRRALQDLQALQVVQSPTCGQGITGQWSLPTGREILASVSQVAGDEG